MNTDAHISAVLAGYGAIAFGILKGSWVLYGAHFYGSGLSHSTQSPLAVDLVLIGALIGGGLALVARRALVPALVITFAVCLFEAAFLHTGPHGFWQLSLIVSALLGQTLVLCLNLTRILSPEGRPSRNHF